MLEPDRLSPEPDRLAEPPADTSPGIGPGATEDELAGPDRGREHAHLYWVLLVVLVAGSVWLQWDSVAWYAASAAHSVMETVATVLAFIIGGLALVRYYSRKQFTFLLIGCGFLGAGLLDLNHALITSDFFIQRRVEFELALDAADADFVSQFSEDLFAWSWTAERMFLSIFLFSGFWAWRREVGDRGAEALPEGTVYGVALGLAVANLLIFEWYFPGRNDLPHTVAVSRPFEFLPAFFFLLAFLGFLSKRSWRRDPFEHWMLASLLIAVLAHGAYMAFSEQLYDAMFVAAHLLKIASYAAILTGLLFSVYSTFRREGQVLDALTESNEALGREIDVRADTEQAVKQTSARLQAFLDNANDLIQTVTHDGRIRYVNSSWKNVLGYTDEDLQRLNLFEIVHPEHRNALEQEFKRVVDGGRPGRFDVEYVASDGRVVMLSGSVQAQSGKAGESVAIQSILRDVTEQRLAERQLDESQRNLEALVENTGDSIWSVDRDHKLITMNSAFALAVEATTGSEPAVGQLPSHVFLPDDVEWYRELYDRTLSGERHVAVRTEDVDGQLSYIELYANPIHALEGVSGAVFFGKDVTRRVRADEALVIARDEAESANKAKSHFLANMSHELRTPLNSVIGFTNILLKNKGERLNQKDISFLERVLSNGKHLLALINEVLDLAKVESGRMELIIEEVDLAHLCVETVQQLEGQAKAKEGDVALLADVPDEVAAVETDSAKLKQVIINLVGNALKFTHKGSVTVGLDLGPDGMTPVAITVVDTGIGIPTDRLEAIFEAFQQAEAGTSRQYGGTGLGLALSRSICLLMGYDLIVESEVGKGSTFKIVLGERAERPVKESEAEVEAEAVPTDGEGRAGALLEAVAAAPAVGHPDVAVEGPASSPPRQNVRDFNVLVVDDEKDSRVLIAHYLEEFGCRVITAGGGEQGLALAREHAPDLMTLDLIMPGLSGWEVLERMKADPDLRRIPVVVVSVVAGEERGSLLGAVDILTKPFEREDLLRVLWRQLGRTRSGRMLFIVDAPDLRTELERFLTERGLEVVTRIGAMGLLEALDMEAPDAVLLDLAIQGMDAIGFLEEMRDNRLYRGLPVFVLAEHALTEDQRDKLRDLSAVVVSREDPVETLDDVLGVLFPVADPAERSG